MYIYNTISRGSLYDPKAKKLHNGVWLTIGFTKKPTEDLVLWVKDLVRSWHYASSRMHLKGSGVGSSYEHKSQRTGKTLQGYRESACKFVFRVV